MIATATILHRVVIRGSRIEVASDASREPIGRPRLRSTRDVSRGFASNRASASRDASRAICNFARSPPRLHPFRLGRRPESLQVPFTIPALHHRGGREGRDETRSMEVLMRIASEGGHAP